MAENTTREIPENKEGRAHSFWEMVRFAMFALIIVVPIRMFVAQPFIVSGNSMVPTFHDNEYLIVDQLSYRFFEEPMRNDVIIFKYPKDTSKYFIKRIIGLPEETVVIKGSKITIRNDQNPEGFVIEEPYVTHQSENDMTVELGEEEYFVMGDNRVASSDSRVWGPLPRKLVVGRAYLRLLPLSQISYLPGAYSLNNVQ